MRNLPVRTRAPNTGRGRLLLLAWRAARPYGVRDGQDVTTARTATEQMLLTNAWDTALQRVDFRPSTGVPVYLDTTNINAAIDQGWIVSSIRQAMLQQGVLLRAKPEQAQWVVEARVGAYGTNDDSWLIGSRRRPSRRRSRGFPRGRSPRFR